MFSEWRIVKQTFYFNQHEKCCITIFCETFTIEYHVFFPIFFFLLFWNIFTVEEESYFATCSQSLKTFEILRYTNISFAYINISSPLLICKRLSIIDCFSFILFFCGNFKTDPFIYSIFLSKFKKKGGNYYDWFHFVLICLYECSFLRKLYSAVFSFSDSVQNYILFNAEWNFIHYRITFHSFQNYILLIPELIIIHSSITIHLFRNSISFIPILHFNYS